MATFYSLAEYLQLEQRYATVIESYFHMPFYCANLLIFTQFEEVGESLAQPPGCLLLPAALLAFDMSSRRLRIDVRSATLKMGLRLILDGCPLVTRRSGLLVLQTAARHQHAGLVALRGNVERRVRGEEVCRSEVQLVNLNRPVKGIVSHIAFKIILETRASGCLT